MLRFYKKTHPFPWIEEELKRYDEELRLVWDTEMDRWKVVRRTLEYDRIEIGRLSYLGWVRHTWYPVRVCQWSDGQPRAPGQWLLHSLFDGRIQVKTPEQAAKWIREKRRKERDRSERRRHIVGRKTEEIARSAHKHINAKYVTVDGLKR